MNKVELVGRLTADPEVKYTTGENATARCSFSVAVNRPFKNAEGNYDADFIRCVAFRQAAEILGKYFKKGQLIGIEGNIRTGKFTGKDGQTVYTTDVYVDRLEFVGGKNESGGSGGNTQTSSGQSPTDFMSIPDDANEELPF